MAHLWDLIHHDLAIVLEPGKDSLKASCHTKAILGEQWRLDGNKTKVECPLQGCLLSRC